MGKKKTGDDQPQLDGMPERETPQPLQKVVRVLSSVTTVKRDQEQAIEEAKARGKGATIRTLYQRTIKHTSVQMVNAVGDTAAINEALAVLDAEVETLAEFESVHQGVCKSTFSVKEEAPRVKE